MLEECIDTHVDPVLNPLYRDVLAHYGVVALPCRVRHPDRKGKVESAVAYAQKAYRGRRFESLEAAQAFVSNWESRWADTRIHGTTKKQVRSAFEEERLSLKPLPPAPFRYYRRLQRRVHPNGCVEVDKAYYGVPTHLIGELIEAQADDMVVRLLDPKTGELIREHVKQRAGHYRIKPQDRPKSTPPQVAALLRRSKNLGDAVAALCGHLYRQEPQVSIKRIQGLVGFAKKYGKESLNDACQTALDCDAKSYRFVKTYLERTTKQPKQHDPIIRELREYQQLIMHMVRGETQ